MHQISQINHQTFVPKKVSWDLLIVPLLYTQPCVIKTRNNTSSWTRCFYWHAFSCCYLMSSSIHLPLTITGMHFLAVISWALPFTSLLQLLACMFLLLSHELFRSPPSYHYWHAFPCCYLMSSFIHLPLTIIGMHFLAVISWALPCTSLLQLLACILSLLSHELFHLPPSYKLLACIFLLLSHELFHAPPSYQ